MIADMPVALINCLVRKVQEIEWAERDGQLAKNLVAYFELKNLAKVCEQYGHEVTINRTITGYVSIDSVLIDGEELNIDN